MLQRRKGAFSFYCGAPFKCLSVTPASSHLPTFKKQIPRTHVPASKIGGKMRNIAKSDLCSAFLSLLDRQGTMPSVAGKFNRVLRLLTSQRTHSSSHVNLLVSSDLERRMTSPNVFRPAQQPTMSGSCCVPLHFTMLCDEHLSHPLHKHSFSPKHPPLPHILFKSQGRNERNLGVRVCSERTKRMMFAVDVLLCTSLPCSNPRKHCSASICGLGSHSFVRNRSTDAVKKWLFGLKTSTLHRHVCCRRPTFESYGSTSYG